MSCVVPCATSETLLTVSPNGIYSDRVRRQLCWQHACASSFGRWSAQRLTCLIEKLIHKLFECREFASQARKWISVRLSVGYHPEHHCSRHCEWAKPRLQSCWFESLDQWKANDSNNLVTMNTIWVNWFFFRKYHATEITLYYIVIFRLWSMTADCRSNTQKDAPGIRLNKRIHVHVRYAFHVQCWWILQNIHRIHV